MRRLNKPKTCPGCEKNNINFAGQRLCFDCQDMIKKGKFYTELEKKQSKDSELMKVILPASWEKPYFHHHDDNTHGKLGGLFRDLAHSLCEWTSPGERSYYRDEKNPKFEVLGHGCWADSQHHYWSWAREATMKRKHALMLSQLLALTRKSIDDAYKMGLEKGKSALIQLAEGTITTKEFDAVK